MKTVDDSSSINRNHQASKEESKKKYHIKY